MTESSHSPDNHDPLDQSSIWTSDLLDEFLDTSEDSEVRAFDDESAEAQMSILGLRDTVDRKKISELQSEIDDLDHQLAFRSNSAKAVLLLRANRPRTNVVRLDEDQVLFSRFASEPIVYQPHPSNLETSERIIPSLRPRTYAEKKFVRSLEKAMEENARLGLVNTAREQRYGFTVPEMEPEHDDNGEERFTHEGLPILVQSTDADGKPLSIRIRVGSEEQIEYFRQQNYTEAELRLIERDLAQHAVYAGRMRRNRAMIESIAQGTDSKSVKLREKRDKLVRKLTLIQQRLGILPEVPEASTPRFATARPLGRTSDEFSERTVREARDPLDGQTRTEKAIILALREGLENEDGLVTEESLAHIMQKIEGSSPALVRFAISKLKQERLIDEHGEIQQDSSFTDDRGNEVGFEERRSSLIAELIPEKVQRPSAEDYKATAELEEQEKARAQQEKLAKFIVSASPVAMEIIELATGRRSISIGDIQKKLGRHATPVEAQKMLNRLISAGVVVAERGKRGYSARVQPEDIENILTEAVASMTMQDELQALGATQATQDRPEAPAHAPSQSKPIITVETRNQRAIRLAEERKPQTSRKSGVTVETRSERANRIAEERKSLTSRKNDHPSDPKKARKEYERQLHPPNYQA